ncbi:TolC family protein [Phocaeicola barnesiae]|uniref:TolC family protein n=1 Tax=Phocaeicola barnesiae TaxID=376804 RepID=UPI0025A4C35D|nr:TolC family protein [Phocaeicola barnesiae]MDM8307736.1 TolC family protein [Phocaeicola barnesiae]
MTSRSLERGTLNKQIFPETLPTGIPVRLLSRRPDIVQAEMTLANAYYTTNQARSVFYPNLNLSGSAGWTNALGQAVTNPGDWILSAVASLTQPLFNRGKLISNLRVSKDEEQIALLDAGQEVNDALYATESAGRSLESHRKQCRELERTVQTSEALYRTGNATYLELLTTRQSLLNARLNVVTDSFTQCQAVINLYQALGGGAE